MLAYRRPWRCFVVSACYLSIHPLKNHYHPFTAKGVSRGSVTNSFLVRLLFSICFFCVSSIHLLWLDLIFISLCDVIPRTLFCWFVDFNYFVLLFFLKLVRHRSLCLLGNWQTRNRLKRFRVILFDCIQSHFRTKANLFISFVESWNMN